MIRPSTARRRRESQGGFALLMVFLMAAIIALMLYQQLPRVAFESEREKEQLLIDRGEQYTRAIQLYYLANNRQYPTSLDDLEKQEKRFLRHRFVDPFTGKAEWRIIHTNGGFLTDSLVQKPPTDNQSQSASNTSGGSTGSTTSNTSNNNGTGTTATNEPPQVNAAVLQRPSDRPLTPPGFGQGAVAQDPSGQPVNTAVNTALPPITLLPQQGQAALPPITLQPGATNQPGGLPPITLAPIGGAGSQQNTGVNPGINPGQGQAPGQNQTQLPGQVPGQGRPTLGGTAGVPGQPGPLGGIPGVPPGFQIDSNGQLVPSAAGPGGQTPGIPGQSFTPQPATSGPVQGSPSAALTAINQLLTSPRQVNTPASTTPSSNQVGAIAGIASTHKGPSIKLYKDQAKYELWEFVFSLTANNTPGAATPGAGIPPNGGAGAPGQAGTPSTFAPSGTFGPSGGQSTMGTTPGR